MTCPVCNSEIVALGVTADGWLFACDQGHEVIFSDQDLEASTR